MLGNNITDMASSLIFNTCLANPSAKYTHLLSYIALHPAFKSKVNEYYQILGLSTSVEGLVRLGSLYFAMVLPDLPAKCVKYLAEQLLESIRTHESKVTYNNLTEYLLKLCAFSVENIDVRSAIGFLELLKSRITDTFVASVGKPGERRRINVDIKL